MHMQGRPKTMQVQPKYEDVVAEVLKFLQTCLDAAQKAGISLDQTVIDPGIGFGKTGAHNLALLANLDRFRILARPICLGVSRKAFIGGISGQPAEQRAAGTLAVACHAICHNAVQIIRTHDVRITHDAMLVLEAIGNASA
jgi:dihydropteroate synthase